MSSRSIAKAGWTGDRRTAKGLVTLLLTAMTRQKARARLAQLDSHLLHDIGLSAEAAEAEAKKPIWR